MTGVQTCALPIWLGKKLAVDVEPLLAAIPDEPFPSLARQVSAITAAMAEPLTGPIPRFYTTDLHKLDSFRRFCQDLASDPRNCAAAYNEAAAALPEAGVPGLRIEARRVELPLWLLQWNQPRQRVFAQTRPGTDGGRLVDERDHELEPETWLAPRALALTAFLRGQCCDLFIHGTGGAIYDRVMGHWLEKWGQQTPAPHVVASADLYLDFPVPVSDERAVAQAQWKAHHLPHNLERHLPADGPAAQRKRELLDHMNDDRDRPRKAAAFAEIHQINAGLAARFGSAIAEAQAELNRALAGKANRAIAQKRDWFFGLYPAKQLRQLRAAVEAAAEVGARGQ